MLDGVLDSLGSRLRVRDPLDRDHVATSVTPSSVDPPPRSHVFTRPKSEAPPSRGRPRPAWPRTPWLRRRGQTPLPPRAVAPPHRSDGLAPRAPSDPAPPRSTPRGPDPPYPRRPAAAPPWRRRCLPP